MRLCGFKSRPRHHFKVRQAATGIEAADSLGDVAKRLRRRSAKPLCGGSNPPVASNTYPLTSPQANGETSPLLPLRRLSSPRRPGLDWPPTFSSPPRTTLLAACSCPPLRPPLTIPLLVPSNRFPRMAQSSAFPKNPLPEDMRIPFSFSQISRPGALRQRSNRQP